MPGPQTQVKTSNAPGIGRAWANAWVGGGGGRVTQVLQKKNCIIVLNINVQYEVHYHGITCHTVHDWSCICLINQLINQQLDPLVIDEIELEEKLAEAIDQWYLETEQKPLLYLQKNIPYLWPKWPN